MPIPTVIPHYRSIVSDAAHTVGRNAEEIGIVIGAVCVVDDDGAARVRWPSVKWRSICPSSPSLDPTVALDPELLLRLKKQAAAYDFDAAAALISDELLVRFALAGTPDEVASHAADLLAAGAARVEFGTPHGLAPETGLRLLGTRVLPAIRHSE